MRSPVLTGESSGLQAIEKKLERSAPAGSPCPGLQNELMCDMHGCGLVLRKVE